MLKTQYPTDYLKKEGVNSEVIDQLEKQHTEQIHTSTKLKRYRRSDTHSSTGQQGLPLPENFEVKSAIGGGDCFFDSVAQGLKQLKPEMDFTVQSLRKVCKRFAQDQLNKDPSWLKEALKNENEPINEYIPRIEFTANDIEQGSGIISLLRLTSPIWGRIEIEGRIICKEYNVKLHVIEKHNVQGKEIWTNQIVDELGSRSIDDVDYNEANTVHVVNKGRLHFEPILNKARIENIIRQENRQSPSDNRQHRSDRQPEPRAYGHSVQVNNPVEQPRSSLTQHAAIGQSSAQQQPDSSQHQQGSSNIRQALVSDESIEIEVDSGENRQQLSNNRQPRSDRQSESGASGQVSNPIERPKAQNQPIEIVEQHLNSLKNRVERSDSNLLPGSSKHIDVNNRLEKFVECFVQECEARLLSYHMILEGEVKLLKISGQASELIIKAVAASASAGVMVGAAAAGPSAPLIAPLAPLASQLTTLLLTGVLTLTEYTTNSVYKYGHKKYLSSLLKLIDESQKNKANFKNRLVEAGIDIFQSFEMQFMRVTTDKGTKDAMEKLAKDAKNRAVNYMRKGGDISIPEAVILGQSNVGWSIRPGFKVNYQYQPLKEDWYTANLYEKVGLIIQGEIYKKQDGKSETTKYGYRRLLTCENWEKSREKYESDKVAKSKSMQFTNYQYILDQKSLKEKSSNILDNLKKSSGLGKQEIESIFEESKDDLLSEVRKIKTFINNLQGEIHNYQEDRRILEEIETNLKNLKIDKYLKKFEQYFEEAKHERQQILKSVEDLRGENKEGHAKTHEILENLGQEKLASKQVLFNMKNPVATFIGRDNELGRLDSENEQIFVITGLGGIGKSELARKYAYNKRNNYNVVWINAKTLESLKKSFQKLSEELKEKISKSTSVNAKRQKILRNSKIGNEEKNIKLIVKDIYEYFRNVKSLFIFDDAERYEEIRKFLPQSSLSNDKRPYVLITSRSKEWTIDEEEGEIKVLELNTLSFDEAKQFIKKVLDVQADADVERLAEQLQCFPLGLKQAVTYIKKEDDKVKLRSSGKFSISDYLKDYTKQKEKLLGEGGYENSGRYTQTVLTTWDITLEKIKSNAECGKQAIDIFNIMAYLASDDVNVTELFSKLVTDEKQMWNAVELLNKYSMINLEKGISNIHRLVQEVTILNIQKQNKEAETLDKALELLKNIEEKGRIGTHVMSIWGYASNHGNLIKKFIVDANNEDNSRLLQLFIENNHVLILKKILKYIEVNHADQLGRVVNAADNNGDTPVHSAATQASIDVVNYLVSKGAEINAKNNYGETPIHHAAFNGNLDILKYLINKSTEAVKLDKAEINAQDNGGNTPLHYAALSNHLDVVKYIVDKDNANINARNNDRKTPLHYAVHNGKLEIVEYLVEKDADINAKDDSGKIPLELAINTGKSEIVQFLVRHQDKQHGYTALHYAAKEGNLKLVKLLIDNSANLNSKSNDDSTPLHLAALNDKLEIIKYLVEKDADINAKNNSSKTPLELAIRSSESRVIQFLINQKDKQHGYTALHYAAKEGNLKLVELLIDNSADFNSKSNDDSTPLHLAALNGKLDVVKYLVNDKNVNFNTKDKEGNIPLHLAALSGELDTVKYFVDEKNVDVNTKAYGDSTPLHLAAYSGKLEVIKYLVEKDADINAKDDSGKIPLELAINTGKSEIVQFLVRHQDKQHGYTALHYAAKEGNLKLVKLLIDNSADLDSKNNDGNTPIHFAAKNGHLDMVKYLIGEKSADFNAKNNNGKTPLELAVSNGNPQIVEFLVNQKNKQNGNTLLHYAAIESNLDLVKLLLNNGADLNSRNNDGNTPIHFAAKNGHLDMVKYLIGEKSADFNAKNNNGKTPLELAVSNGNPQIVEFLVNQKNKQNGNTLLHYAAIESNLDLVELLLDNGADLNSRNNDGNTPLHFAAFYGRLEVVKYLVDDKKVNIYIKASNGNTPLHSAAENGKLDVVKYFVDKKKVDVYIKDSNNKIPLHYAAANGKLDVVKYFVDEKKVNVYIKASNGNTPLHFAAKNGKLNVVSYFVDEKKVDVYIKANNGKTSLHLAAENGKLDTVKYLVTKEGGFKNFGNTLYWAIIGGKLDVVKYLVDDKNVDVHTKTGAFFYTPIHWAALNGKLDIVRYLVDEKNIDVNTKSGTCFWTSLHLAAQNGHLDTVRYLVENGANLNAKIATDLYTPLHFAALYGHLDTVIYLVENGADVNARLLNFYTPLDLAKDKLGFVSFVSAVQSLSTSETYPKINRQQRNSNSQQIINFLETKGGRGCSIQNYEKQQKAFIHLGKYIDSNFPDTETKAVKQGLYLPSFESRNIQINGKCAAITRIFSQELFLEQQGSQDRKPHESFLNNLQTSAELYERLAQGKQISSREEKEIFAFSRLLDNVEKELNSPTSSLPSHLSPIKSYRTLGDLSLYINRLTDDFAIHLVTSNHVVAIYRTGDSYTYFDSNVALVSDLKSVDQLMQVVKKGVKYAGYALAEEGFLVEHFDVSKANNALTPEQKEVLIKSIQTEHHLLSLQDQEHGLIDVNGKQVSRVILYDMGAKLHIDGSSPVLINSEMSSEDLVQDLSSGKIKVTAREYLQNLKDKKKEVIQDLVQTTSSLPFSGSINEVKDANTIQDLVLSEDGQKLNSYELNKILSGRVEQSIKALPYYMEVANTKHWPNRLTNAAGRISMAKGFYDIAHSIRYGDTEGFLLGSGEIGFSLFSQLIEDGIVKVTPQFIKQMKHGIFLSRGFAGVISTPFDIYDLVRSSIDLAKAEKGSKEWRDSIAGVVLSGTSVTTSIAFTALGKPGVGTVVGLGIIIGQGFYSGTSMVIEYKKYKLTTNQEFRLFWHTFALQLPPEDVQYLAARQDVVNGLAEQAWEYLQNNTQVAAYGMGLGEIRFENENNTRVKRFISGTIPQGIYVPKRRDFDEMMQAIRSKPKIVVVEPSSASIWMSNPSNERNGKNLSRIVPVSPSNEAQMLCLPTFTDRDYEYDNKKPLYSNSSTAIYHCHNAMIVGHKHNTIENPTMVFDLSLVNGSGIIVSSSQYRNQFNIAQGGTRIYGGNYTSNVFTLTNDNFFGRVSGGRVNATNILDTSQLKSEGLSYENNIITTQEAQMTAKNINHFIGRNSADEHVDCQNMNKKMIVDSRGGNSRNSDIISNCKQVVVTGNTKVVSNESDNTFYIKPSNGYAEINGEGKGFIIFSDTALLEKASNISYLAANNTLSLQIGLQEDNNGTFTLDINNYLDRENNHNYVLIDKYGSVIEPLIQPNSTEVTHFNLKAEANLTTNAEVVERYQEISQTNNYTVYGVIRDLAERYTIFGSNDSDVIPLTKNVTFAQGNEESDVYSLIPDEQVNVTINNYDENKAIDMLYLPMNVTLAEAEKVENDLHISIGNATINVENYFRNSSYKHLTVIDKNKNTFLPWSNNQSHLQFVPFFHATKDQYIFLLSAEKVQNNPEVIVDSKLDDIRFYRDENDLVLIDDKPLIIKVENFYGNQYGNFTLNFRNKEKLSAKQLSELAKIAINYQDEVRSNYYDSFREYTMSNVNSTIHHNQRFINGSLTTVEPNDKRVGILLLQDPFDIEVSADNNDLVFFVGQNNATFVIKNWNDTDHRISMLKFGDENKSIEVRKLDKFDLSEISEIQSLIDKAAISNTVDQQLERLDNEVVNGLKYLLASNGIVNKVNVHDCLGFDSIEDQQEFVAAYSTFYSKDKLQEILQDSQVVEALILLIAKGHINLSLKDPDKEKHLLLKDLDQCFGAKNNFTIKNQNDRVSVLKFNQSIEVDLSEVSEIQHLIGKYGISNTANQQLEKLGNEVVNDFKYLLVSIDIENGIDVYNCLAEKDTQKILNPYYYEWVNWNFVKDLIEEKKVDVNSKANDGNTLLHEAASSGNLGIVQYLIDEKKVDVNTKANDGRTTLHHAAASGSLNLVKYLVDEKGVNVNTKDNNGKTALHYAAYSGNLDLVKYLVDEESVDINTKDNDCNTILHEAASSGNLDLVNYFIGKGADVNTKTKGHWTPLHKAAEKGNEEIVLALLEKGVDVNAKTNGGYTALHWAALSGNKETVLALLNNGANVNAKIDSGETPLHLAASKGNKEAVLALLNKGADINAKDDSGWTPLRTAEHHGKGEIVVLLNHQTHQRSRRAINEENIASSATRVGSGTNDLFGWVKNSIGGLFNSRAALPENNTTQSSISQVDAQVNVDGTIMLLDLLIRKVTGQKHISTEGQSISLLEAQGYALNITTKFEQVLNETAFKSGISVTNLNFNPVAVQSTLAGQIRNGKFSEVLKILYSSAEKACPEFKQIDKFLACLANHLEEVVAEKEVELLVRKQKSLSKAISNNSVPQAKVDNKPNTFLNDTLTSKQLSYVHRVKAESSWVKSGVRIG